MVMMTAVIALMKWTAVSERERESKRGQKRHVFVMVGCIMSDIVFGGRSDIWRTDRGCVSVLPHTSVYIPVPAVPIDMTYHACPYTCTLLSSDSCRWFFVITQLHFASSYPCNVLYINLTKLLTAVPQSVLQISDLHLRQLQNVLLRTYFLSMQNLVAYENHARTQSYVTLSSLYDNKHSWTLAFNITDARILSQLWVSRLRADRRAFIWVSIEH